MANWPRNRDPKEAQRVRRAQLIAKYHHTPEPIPWNQLPMILRVTGIRDEIHPNDCTGFVYASRAEFTAWSRSNRKYWHNDSFGPFVIEGLGIVGVVEFREQLVDAGGAVTDPKLPDDTPIPPRKPKPKPTQNGKG